MEDAAYRGWTISVTVTAADLFQGREDLLINKEWSKFNCSEYLRLAIEREYPGANVRMECKDGIGTSIYIETEVHPPKAGDELLTRITAEYVRAAVRMHFLSGKWIVYKLDG